MTNTQNGQLTPQKDNSLRHKMEHKEVEVTLSDDRELDYLPLAEFTFSAVAALLTCFRLACSRAAAAGLSIRT